MWTALGTGRDVSVVAARAGPTGTGEPGETLPCTCVPTCTVYMYSYMHVQVHIHVPYTCSVQRSHYTRCTTTSRETLMNM